MGLSAPPATKVIVAPGSAENEALYYDTASIQLERTLNLIGDEDGDLWWQCVLFNLFVSSMGDVLVDVR